LDRVNYVFDVDGTLSESRQVIPVDFRLWFLNWMKNKSVFIVTGSDRPKTIEQIGHEIVDNCTMVFQCAGNSVWRNGVEVSSSNLNAPEDMDTWLEQQVDFSKYKHKFGNHIEKRTGLINFSTVGRNAVGQQRDDYYEWDQVNNERVSICEMFNKTFQGFEAELGGNTSIDIHLKGKNKAQVYDIIGTPMIFFGDRIHVNGNDKPLADKMTNPGDKWHQVKGPYDTWDILKEDYS
jgi:phosphomannomutase